jgi:hypothetical protein
VVPRSQHQNLSKCCTHQVVVGALGQRVEVHQVLEAG